MVKWHCLACSAEFFLERGEDSCPYCNSKRIDKFWEDTEEEYYGNE